MLSGTIRERLREVPFSPFGLRLNDGRFFRVPHPDYAGVSPKGGSITVYNERDAALPISALLVASVEPLPPAPSRPKSAR